MPKREHRSNAEWQDIIEQQEQSGLTGVAFCLQEGIYAKTFYCEMNPSLISILIVIFVILLAGDH